MKDSALIGYRPATENDMDFLYALHAASIKVHPEFQGKGFGTAIIRKIIRMVFKKGNLFVYRY